MSGFSSEGTRITTINDSSVIICVDRQGRPSNYQYHIEWGLSGWTEKFDTHGGHIFNSETFWM